MSIKRTLFLALQEQLRQLPSVKWVDKLMGQVNNLDNHVIPYPAVLIEFGRWEPKTIGKNVQKGPLIIRFHLLFENFGSSFEGSEDKDQAIAYFDFVEEIHAGLQGFSGEGWTAMERTGEDEDNDHGIIIDTVIEYQTEVSDNSSDKDKDRVLTANEVTPGVQVKRPLTRPQSTIISEFKV